MPSTYKNAKIQGSGSLTTYATLYGTTASTTAVISTIAICNASNSEETYRIGIDSGEGTPSTSLGEWLVYDTPVPANDTVFLTVGVSLGNTQYLRVSSSSNTINFHAFISEIS